MYKLQSVERKPARRILYPLTMTIRLDEDTDRELETIAFFERMSKCAFVRMLVVEAVQRYQRNPQYLRFKRQLEAKLSEQKKEGGGG